MENNTPSSRGVQVSGQTENTDTPKVTLVPDTKGKKSLRNFPVGVNPLGFSTDLSFDQRTAETCALMLHQSKFLMMGFDAEWVERKGDRKVLSYQTYVLVDGVRQKGFIYYMEGRDEGKRLRLEELVEKTIKDFRKEFPDVDWPEVVVLVGHYTVADLSALRCFRGSSKKKFNSVRRTLTTLDPETTWRRNLRMEDGSTARVSVSLRDTLLLAPQGMAKLEKLGAMLGLEKIKISRRDKKNMDQLLRRDRPLFERYAIRDAEVSVKYAAALAGLFLDMIRSAGGVPFVPTTLASLTGVFVESIWRKDGIDREAVLGKETVKMVEYLRKQGRYNTRRVEVDQVEFYENLPIALESYHGGWNDAYYFGFTPEEDITDFDLKSAYMAPLAMLGMPQWDEIRQTTNVEEFQPGVLGAARISFEFPESVRFPTLSVRTTSGSLIRPRKHNDKEAREKKLPRAYATATEIALARKLGAEVTIHAGFVVPCDDTVRPFEKVVKQGLALRQQFRDSNGKGCAEELLVKELLNSIYGKLAQGLRKKRAFDSKSGKHKDLKPHWLTQPYIAGFVTGVVRAALGEIANNLPADKSVYTITTDGFLSSATVVEVEKAAHGSVCDLLRTSRKRTADDEEIIEVKHRARQALIWRRRSGASVIEVPGSKPIIAKAGLKPPVRWSDRFGREEEEDFDDRLDCRWVISKFLRRRWGQKVLQRRMPGLYELYHDDIGPEDFVEVREWKRLGMDYDFGQRPDVELAVDREITWRLSKEKEGHFRHVAFSTRPWDTLEDHLRARDEWEQWTRGKGRIMREKADVADFMIYFNLPKVPGLYRGRSATPLKQAVRVFVRAYSQEGLGLKRIEVEDERGKKQANEFLRVMLKAALAPLAVGNPKLKEEVYSILNIPAGTPAKDWGLLGKKPGQNLIENARRKGVKVPVHGVPRTPETVELVKNLRSLFIGKGLDESQFFNP